MANRIKLKRSSVSGNAPTTGDIEVGEVALNMADQVIHYRDASDNIKQIVHGPSNDLEAVKGTFTIDADSTLSITDTPNLFGNAFNTSVAEITSEGRWPIFAARHFYGGASNSFSGFANAALQFETFGGTIASPLATEANKRILTIAGSASNDTSGNAPLTSNVVILGITTEAQTATNRGANLTIATIPDGATSRQDSAIFQGNESTFFKTFVKTSNGGSDGLVIENYTIGAGTEGPVIRTFGTDQDLYLSANGAGSVYVDSQIYSGGIFNTATSGPQRGLFVRNSKNPAISTERNGQGNLADGQTTSSIAFGVRGDDANAFPGFIWMEYADPGEHTFYLTAWDDGVTTFNEKNVMEARADRIRFMENSLIMQKFSTDVVIKPATGLAYSFESADADQLLSISDSNIIVKTNATEIARFTDNEVSFQKPLSTKGIINVATDGGSRGQFIRNSLYGAIEISRNGQGNLADDQTSSSFQFKIDGDDADAFPGIVYMGYHSTNGNVFAVDVYDDGVSTFNQKTVIEARANNFKVLEGDLTITTDGTDQTIAAAGVLTIPQSLKFGATTPSDNDVLTYDSATATWGPAAGGGGGGGGNSIAVLAGTNTYTSLTIPQTTFITLPHTFSEVADPDSIVTVSGDTFTISAAGTYIIEYNGVDSIYSTFWPTNTTNQMVRSPYCHIQLYDDTAAAEVETWYGNPISIGANTTAQHTHQLGQVFMRSVVTLTAANTYSLKYKTFNGTNMASPSIIYAYDNGPSVMITKIA